jgi:hypothetical protein
MEHPTNAPTKDHQAGSELQFSPEVELVMKKLAAPFDPSEVKWKPQVVSGNRAMAIAYVDARVIQDRLDDVLGSQNWQDDYDCLPDGCVVCRLRLRLGEEWITKVDVGGPSEQPDGGDRMKAAFSESLKRAAVKFGIGRYLYRLPQQWVDYDPQKRQFLRTPSLPVSALPVREEEAAASSTKDRQAGPAKNGTSKPRPTQPAPARQSDQELPAATGRAGSRPSAPAPRTAPARPAARLGSHALPANGAELQKRLSDYDTRLAAQGVCQAGDLLKHIVQAGVKAGYDADLTTWTGPAIALAVEETKSFEAGARRRQAEQKVA